jgi:hypothetical protein
MPATAMTKEQKSANINVRIPGGQKAILQEIAERLKVTLNLVVACILQWNLEASKDQELWMRAVKTLRELVPDDENGLQLYDFDSSEWDERLNNYRDMEMIGLIDDLSFRQSASTKRWLCSFWLTNRGRVIASILQDRAEDDSP